MDLEQLEQTLYGNVEEDEDLLAELYAMEAEEKRAAVKKPLRNTQSPCTTAVIQPPKDLLSAIPTQEIKEALADINTDTSESDEDLDDPELLAEFSSLIEVEGNISGNNEAVSSNSLMSPANTVDMALLQKLKSLEDAYNKAVSAAGDNAPKLRRYQRTLDKIHELIKKVERGVIVNEQEIPIAPVGFVNAAEIAKNVTTKSSITDVPPPLPPRPKVFDSQSTAGLTFAETNKNDTDSSIVSNAKVDSQQNSSDNTSLHKVSTDQTAAQQEIPPGSSHCLKASEMLRILKERRDAYLKNAKAANDANDKHAAFGFYTVVKQFDQAIAMADSGEVLECDESELPPLPKPYQATKKDTLPIPKTFLEGLNQRMTVYKNFCQQNKDNDDRKFRMNARFVKRYEEAIAAYTAKRPYNFNDLPCPPGCPPLPSFDTSHATAHAQKPISSSNAPKSSSEDSSAVHSVTGTANKPKVTERTAHAVQIDFLLKRQLQFKQAAIDAKQRKDIALAKKYLLAAKSFTTIIANVQAGKSIDLKKLPVPPQVQPSVTTVKPLIEPEVVEAGFDVIEGSREDIYATLERDLIKQVKQCNENRIGFTKLGDFKQVEYFEELFRETKMDLLYLRQLAKTNSAVPRFRYETRDFPSMQLCADISEDHLELSVVRVMDAKLPSGWKPSDGNIFVKFEFAFPHTAHQSGKTKIVAGTNSPDFSETVLLGINRKSKQLLRTIKRNCLKFEVYQKGGFLRSDKLLGVADCKLTSLETKVQIHEAVELMEGRRPVGGKIEYKVRIREPLGEKKLNNVRERWLVLIKTV